MNNLRKRYFQVSFIISIFFIVFTVLRHNENKVEVTTVYVPNEIIGMNSSPNLIVYEEVIFNPLNEVDYIQVDVPENKKYHGQKTFEYYTAITNKKSNQYKLQEEAKTDSFGFRTVNGRYLVAIGTYFNAPVGTYIDLVLENETEIHCIVGDIKADCDTDTDNVFTHQGCCSEFIVDKSFVSLTSCPGDVSSVFDNWDSKVLCIRVYDKNYLD